MERKGRGGHLTQGTGIVYSAVGVLVSVSQVLLVTRVELETKLCEDFTINKKIITDKHL